MFHVPDLNESPNRRVIGIIVSVGRHAEPAKGNEREGNAVNAFAIVLLPLISQELVFGLFEKTIKHSAWFDGGRQMVYNR